MFWWLLVSLFGLISAFRTTICVCERENCGESTKNFAVIGAILLSLFVSFVLSTHLMAQFLFATFIFLTPMIISRGQLLLRRHYLQANFVSILDEIILEMRMGRSFRESFQKSSLGQPKWVQKLFDELLTAFVLRQAISAREIDEGMLRELRDVFLASLKQLDRLRSLRRRLKIERDFRQKSRKALIQVRMQSLILSLLFVPLLIYQLWNRGWVEQKAIVTVSTVLFVAGAWWIVGAGRRYQWKI